MSTALSSALRARLTGIEDLTGYPIAQAAQAALSGLLAADPRKDANGVQWPMVRYGSRASTPAFPAIVFRQDAGRPDDRPRGIAVSDTIYRLEIWAQGASGTVLTDIQTQILRLLQAELRYAPPLPLEQYGAGHCYWMEQFTEWTDDYDKTNNEWWSFAGWRFKEGQA